MLGESSFGVTSPVAKVCEQYSKLYSTKDPTGFLRYRHDAIAVELPVSLKSTTCNGLFIEGQISYSSCIFWLYTPRNNVTNTSSCRTIELKDNTVIVVLGASGDLAKKKTVGIARFPIRMG